MYLELFGMPGVGKTTMYNLITDRNNNYVKICKNHLFYNLNIIPLFKALVISNKIYKLVKNEYFNQSKYLDNIDNFCKFKNSLVVAFYFYYKYKDNISNYITHHGIIQTLSQLKFLREYKNEVFYNKLIKLLPIENIKYVYLKANIATAYKRGSKRAKENKYNHNRTEIEMRHFFYFYNYFGKHLKNIFYINGEKELKDININFILRELE